MDEKDRSHRLGDFEIIRPIGRGGMGVVYEARQRSLNRRVALKVLSSTLGLTDKAVSRFRRAAEAAARLRSELTRKSSVNRIAIAGCCILPI